MNVFDLLGRGPDDSRVLELAAPLVSLDAGLPAIAPGEYRAGSAAARVVGGARGCSRPPGRVGALADGERTGGGGVRCPEWINNWRRSQS